MFHLFPEYEIGQPITIRKWRIIRKAVVILCITSVPYHRLQTGASIKCPFPDSRYGVGYGYLSQAGATVKSIDPDRSYGIGYGYLSQAGATVKSIPPDRCHGIGYGYRFQAAATGKYIVPDSRHGVGYGYRFQAAATGKCIVPDSRHGVGYGDLYQTPVTVKCTVRNTCYRIIFPVIQHRLGNNDLASGIVLIIRYPGLTSVKVIINTIDLKSCLRFYFC